MISQAKIVNYALNFLDSEIKSIEKLLKSKNIDKKSSAMLDILLKKYKHDFKAIKREWM